MSKFRKILNLLSILYFIFISPCHFPTYNSMFVDSGIYAYIGQQINKGKILYKQVWDFKLPGIYYVYAFLFKIFPDSRWALFFADFFTNSIMLLIIYLLLKNIKKEEFFWIFSIFFVNCYRGYACFSGGNLSEHWFVFFFLITFFLLNLKNTPIISFLAGLSFSFLFWFKQPYILFPIILAIFYRNKIKENFLWFLNGFLILFLFFFYTMVKGFPDSIIATFKYPYLWSKISSSERGFENFSYLLSVIWLCGPFKETIFLFLLSILIKDTLLILFSLSFLTCLFIFFITPALYSHYLLLLLIPILIGTLIIMKNYSKKFVIITLIFLSFFSIRGISKKFKHSFISLRQLIIYKDFRIRVHPLCFVIFRHLKAGEKFLMIPDYAEVYFVTQTESPYRFVGLGTINSLFFKEELKKLVREKPFDYVYLEIPIENFEEIFSLKKGDYKLQEIEKNFYRFYLLK